MAKNQNIYPNDIIFVKQNNALNLPKDETEYLVQKRNDFDEIEKLQGKVVFEDNNLINLQFVGEPDKLDKLVDNLKTKEPLEIVRSGSLGISSNSKTLTI